MYSFFIILLLLISKEYSYLILPLNKEKNNIDSIIEPKKVIQNFHNTEIYATIEIGSEKTSVKLYLTDERGELAIGGKNVKNHKYNESLSKTYFCAYNQTKEFYNGMFREILLSKEDFYIKNDNNELLHIEQLNFILGTTSIYMEPYEGVLGLQLPYINSEPDYNIIRSLKTKNIINSYNWFLDLSNIDKGESKMYIGILPHVINKKYDENNMKITNAAKNGVYMNWGLEFSETYYGDTTKNLQKSFKAYIHFNLGLFIGPNELLELLDKEFFDDYINKNICFKEQYDIE